MKAKCFSALVIIAALMITLVPIAGAAPQNQNRAPNGLGIAFKKDYFLDPLTEKQLELKARALEARLHGKAFGRTDEVARGQYVELAREGETALWTVLGEFADFPHNNIATPDRMYDNTSLWRDDFNREHYLDLLFNDQPGANSMHNFYLEQSSGRFTVHGDTTDWVQVPGVAADYNEEYPYPYGVWNFLEQSINGWYDAQITAGKTHAEIDAYLSQFDVWDRYDYNGNGDFDEPDGYIDGFLSVHSGEGEEAGGGVLGTTAIWSHHLYARMDKIGVTGPAHNRMGGIKVGDSDYWVGKYSIVPENGGIGVITHEYAHDLGLPDLYDYPINGTGFWTMMSAGSWLGDGTEDIGSKASHMGAWEKFQLGWLNHDVAYAGQSSTHRLGPMEFNTKQAQGLFVVLPEKEVITEIGNPFAGSYAYYSGMGDNLDNTMTRAFNLPAGATLTAKVKYDIELDWDYAYLTVNGVPVHTNLSTDTNPNNQNFGEGITGSSGGHWVDLTADLSAFAGKTVTIGFRYWTDTYVIETGLMVDEISITGFPVDSAESDPGWSFVGFHVTTGTESKLFSHYYVAEYRTYKGYDNTLKVGPYYFGYLDDPLRQNLVDHFSYQDGLLLHYWDTSQLDNSTSAHPGQGQILPIDAHPDALYRSDGNPWSNLVQTYDSTFTLTPTDGIPNIHHNSVLSPIPSLPAVSVFDDWNSYYDPANPGGSVITPRTGTRIRIVGISAQGSFIQIEVRLVQLNP